MEKLVKHVWIIEAKTWDDDEWHPLCYPTMQRVTVFRTRTEGRPVVKYLFENNGYNVMNIKAGGMPACRYRLTKYKTTRWS